MRLEALLDLALAAERLDDGVAGERLFDLRVEVAGAAPLGEVLRAGPAATTRIPKIEIGTVISATRASTHEIVNIITVTPISSRTDVSIWLSVCCRLWARLSRSLVTRLSRSPRGSWST